MSACAWTHGPMCGYDLETTGVDVENDRIVTASTVLVSPGERPGSTTWLANPGVEIAAEAAAVHGITTEHAIEHGRKPAEVVGELVAQLGRAFRSGVPVVGMNVVFDFTILDRECRRHLGASLVDALGCDVFPVVDVRVLDKRVDPYRAGKRKLVDLCNHYGVRLDQAHDAAADALGALRIAWVIHRRKASVNKLTLSELHHAQVAWHAEQVASFAAYREKKGEPLSDVNGEWPLRQYKGEGQCLTSAGSASSR
jgi:DNA polymerase III epsilon subunit-like protein